ncbi:MAG: DUF1697 domain-containing protein [Candidatus Bathyarchaeia archaeon]|jgi:uncharacterized protein (DUF1697 family)
MARFVVFLRAINVGGHTVTTIELREVFIGLGFQNVSTYKQSGNVILETDAVNPEEIKRKAESKLRDLLGYNVAAFVRTIPQLKAIIKLVPFKGNDNEGTSFLVTFLSNTPSEFPLKLPLIIPKSTAQIISVKGNEVFSVTHGGGEGGLPNPFLESKLKLKATTRNINIITAIVQKFPESDQGKTENKNRV